MNRREFFASGAALVAATTIPTVTFAMPDDPRKAAFLANIKRYLKCHYENDTENGKMSYLLNEILLDRRPDVINYDRVMTSPAHLFDTYTCKAVTPEEEYAETVRVGDIWIKTGTHGKSRYNLVPYVAGTRAYRLVTKDKITDPEWVVDMLVDDIRKEQARLARHNAVMAMYIPIQIIRTVDQSTFVPITGFKIRYASVGYSI